MLVAAGEIADRPEQATVPLDLLRRPQRLVGIVGELHRRPSVRLRNLADERDRLELSIGARGHAAEEVVGQIGAPAEGEIDPSAQGARRLLDRIDVHCVGQHDELVPRVAPPRLPPCDQLARALNRKFGVRPGPFNRRPNRARLAEKTSCRSNRAGRPADCRRTSGPIPQHLVRRRRSSSSSRAIAA